MSQHRVTRGNQLWVRVEAWWDDYALAVHYLRSGDIFTVGDGGDLPTNDSRWTLVEMGPDRAVLVLDDRVEGLDGPKSQASDSRR